MRTLARVLAAAIAALFIGFGIIYMFSPEDRMASVGLEATSDLGLATVRAFIGGGFLAFGIILIAHTVIGQDSGGLRFAILFLLLSIVGRVVGLVADGTDDDSVRNLVPVAAMVAISVGSLALFQRSEHAEPIPAT